MLSPKLPALYFLKNYPIVIEGPSQKSTRWNTHSSNLMYFQIGKT